MLKLLRYRRNNGREPFTEWLSSLRDKVAQARIRIRLRQLETGNFGDAASVGEGVMELRVHIGAGYRVYFAQHGKTIVVLLSGGDKGTQSMDIQRAKEYWQDWKGREHG